MPGILDKIASWVADVPRILTSDAALGDLPGATGQSTAIANLQAQALVNRTEWLYSQRGLHYRFSEVIEFSTNNGLLDSTMLGKFVILKATGNIAYQLDALANMPDNSVLHFMVANVPLKTTTIKAPAGVNIELGVTLQNEIYLMDAEHISIAKLSGKYVVIDCSDSILQVGTPVDGYAVMKNTAIRNGQILQRADVMRLWKWMEANLVDDGNLVTDAIWNSNINFQGCFSKGNGTSTLRLPDDRGMFTRYADQSRGIDLDRPWNQIGGYQADSIAQHSHALRRLNAFVSGGSGQTPGIVPLGQGTVDAATASTGTTETRPKNNSKLPLIRL